MVGESYLRPEMKIKPHGYIDKPIAANHAIVERDRWMIGQSEIVLVDLLHAERVSIGCMFELAWASEIRKHTIVIMEKENIHRHAFVIDSADIVFETLDEALDYLENLSDGTLRDHSSDRNPGGESR